MADTKQKISISRADDAIFDDIGRRVQLESRDLGVRDATGGLFNAQVVRTGTGAGERKVPRHVHKINFQMVYVLKGRVRIWFEERGEVTLKEGDSYVSPGDVPHEV